MLFTDAEKAYLATQPLGRLATARADGTLQNNPVGFRVNEEAGTIDIGGYAMGASRKFRNVAETGLVAFVVDDLASLNPWTVRGIEIRGRAEALAGQAAASSQLSPEIIRIHPERIISWGLNREPGMRGRTVKRTPEGE